MGLIYCIENAETGMRYVGKTSLSAETRLKAHWKGRLGEWGAPRLAEAMRASTRDAFSIHVVDPCVPDGILDECERYWIDQIGSQYPGGYNVLAGDRRVRDRDIRRLCAEGLTDGRIAERLNCTRECIQVRRSSLRIPSVRHVDWDDVDPHLGVKSDGAVAKEFGMSRGTVSKRRESLGIPAHQRVDWSPIDPHLGRRVDSELALRFGVSLAAIRSRRRRLGVPSYQQNQRA